MHWACLFRKGFEVFVGEGSWEPAEEYFCSIDGEGEGVFYCCCCWSRSGVLNGGLGFL